MASTPLLVCRYRPPLRYYVTMASGLLGAVVFGYMAVGLWGDSWGLFAVCAVFALLLLGLGLALGRVVLQYRGKEPLVLTNESIAWPDGTGGLVTVRLLDITRIEGIEMTSEHGLHNMRQLLRLHVGEQIHVIAQEYMAMTDFASVRETLRRLQDAGHIGDPDLG